MLSGKIFCLEFNYSCKHLCLVQQPSAREHCLWYSHMTSVTFAFFNVKFQGLSAEIEYLVKFKSKVFFSEPIQKHNTSEKGVNPVTEKCF